MNWLNYCPIGQGPDLILLHGFAMNAPFLRPLAEKLSAHYRVHLFDLPGFGNNQEHALSSHPAPIAEHLIQHLPEHAIWLGWSLGGLIASWIAIHYPSHVRALVNLASTPYFIAEPNWPGIQINAFVDFLKQLKMNYAQAIQRFLFLQLEQKTAQRTTVRQLKQSIPPLLKVTLDASFQLMINIDLRKQLSSLARPCLYLLGEKDQLIPVEIASYLSGPPMKTVILPEAGHLFFISHPERILTELQIFLAETAS